MKGCYSIDSDEAVSGRLLQSLGPAAGMLTRPGVSRPRPEVSRPRPEVSRPRPEIKAKVEFNSYGL